MMFQIQCFSSKYGFHKCINSFEIKYGQIVRHVVSWINFPEGVGVDTYIKRTEVLVVSFRVKKALLVLLRVFSLKTSIAFMILSGSS